MEPGALIDIVRKAFANVKLDDGIGLWEAQAIDDYEPESTQRAKRATDEKESWGSIPSHELQRCHSSLCFFDAKGMRFHLPAFIVASIRGEVDDPVFHLTNLDEYSASKLTALNAAQKQAVSEYLTWCSEQEDYDFERPSIKEALDNYWS